MKILIVVDLEGISGVVNEKIQCLPNGFLYNEARKSLISDLNSAIEGVLDGGANEVVVYDTHYMGLNILVNELNENAKLILGNPIIIPEEFMRSFDAKILVGFHAMNEEKESTLSHTYSHEIRSIKINGVRVGEIGVEIFLSSYLNVPTVFITGDSVAEKEAKDLVDEIKFVAVKKVMGKESALCRSLKDTQAEIKRVAKESILEHKRIKSLTLSKPFRIETSFLNCEFVNKVFKMNKFYRKKISDKKIIIEGENLYKLWINFKDAIWSNL